MKADINLHSWKSSGYHEKETDNKCPFENESYYHIGFLNYDNSFLYQGIHKYNDGFIEDTYHIRPFPTHYITIKSPELPEPYEYYDGELYNADPNCKHVLDPNYSGVRCLKCSGWFCY